MKLFVITLAIPLFCNTVAGIWSYLILYTTVFSNSRLQPPRYKPDVFKKRFPLIALNLFILITFVVLGLFLAQHFSFFDMELQSPLSMTIQFLLLILIDDTWFYWVHRTMHTTPKIYSKIHKIHHKAFQPFPLEYIYVHPLEWMVGGVGIPIGVGLILLMQGNISIHAFWIFAFWRNFHEVDIHSGIQSRIGGFIPFYGSVEHHDQHHMKNSKGNYASTFTFWDRIMGTNLPPLEDGTPSTTQS